jgi:hypothetical protein
MKILSLLVALLLVPSLAMSTTARARINNIAARAHSNAIEGRQIAAPPWSIACMTDHGPSECGEPCGFTVAAARSHGTGMRSDASSSFCPCPFRVLCHEQRRSKRRCVTARKMKESPSGSAVRSLIPSHRELLRSKAVVVSVAETHGQSSRQAIAPSMSGRAGRELPKGRARAWTNKTPPRSDGV